MKQQKDDVYFLDMLMSEISEDCWCAGWMQDLEYDLWAIIQGHRSAHYGQCDIDEDAIRRLKMLSERCGGWLQWIDGCGATFIPLNEWLPLYDAKAKEEKPSEPQP